MSLIEASEVMITLADGKVLNFKSPTDKIKVRDVHTTIGPPPDKPVHYYTVDIVAEKLPT